MNSHQSLLLRSFGRLGLALVLVFAFILVSTTIVAAQTDSPELINVLEGRIFGAKDAKNYLLMNQVRGDKIYVRVEATSGNLDPFVALLSSEQLAGTTRGEFEEEVQLAIENNRDPLLVVSDYADSNFLAWDDDSGGGFSAAFEFTIPQDGEYFLLVFGSPFTDSFGDYQLVVGLNAPQVLSGNTTTKGDTFVQATSITDTKRAAVQEITASVGEDDPRQRHRLLPLDAEDTLYVHVETTEGNLIPRRCATL